MREFIWAAILATVMVTGLAHYNKAKAGPSMATTFITLNKGVTTEQCLAKAAYKFKEAGIVENVDVQKGTIYAENGDYTAHARCSPENGFVYFVIAGPDSRVAMKALEFITDKF